MNIKPITFYMTSKGFMKKVVEVKEDKTTLICRKCRGRFDTEVFLKCHNGQAVHCKTPMKYGKNRYTSYVKV